MHLSASPVHFFWKRNFLLDFLGSEATYVTLVVSVGSSRHRKKNRNKRKHREPSEYIYSEYVYCDLRSRGFSMYTDSIGGL